MQTKKRNKKYTPKGVRLNALEYVLERHKRVADVQVDKVIRIKIGVGIARKLAEQGRASKVDMNDIIAAVNIVEAFIALGIGVEYQAQSSAAKEALIAVSARALDLEGRFVFKGLEIKAIQELIEIHDAVMDVVTLKEVEDAIGIVKGVISSGKAIRLKEFL